MLQRIPSAIAFCSLLLSSCMSTDFASGQFTCHTVGSSSECPEGQTCAADLLCRIGGPVGAGGALDASGEAEAGDSGLLDVAKTDRDSASQLSCAATTGLWKQWATTESGARSLAADSNYLYVTTESVGKIYRVSKTQENVSEVLLNAPAWAIAVQGTALLWTNYSGADAGIYGATLPGGSGQLLASVSAPWDVATDGTRVYWTGDGKVTAAPVNGGSSTKLSSGELTRAITVSDNQVYWVDLKASSTYVGASSTSGTSPREVASFTKVNEVYQMVADDKDLFFVTDSALYRLSKDGGTPSPISGWYDSLRGVAVSAGCVYWTDFGGNGVWAAPTAGGTAESISIDQNAPQGIVADETGVFWVNSDGGTIMYAPRDPN